MKVLLKENIEKLGERGEIVDVANGYARNYLLPRNFAVMATETNFRQLESERAKIAKRSAAEHTALEAERDQIERTSCTVVAPPSSRRQPLDAPGSVVSPPMASSARAASAARSKRRVGSFSRSRRSHRSKSGGGRRRGRNSGGGSSA